MSTSVGDRILGRMEAVLKMTEEHLQEIRRDRQATQEVIGQLQRAMSIMGEFADAVERMEKIIRRYEHNEIVTSSDLAKELNVSTRTIRRMYHRGDIDGFRIADRGMIRFDREETIKALKGINGRSCRDT